MSGPSSVAGQAEDPFGAPVVIERSRWQEQLIKNHPELAGEVEALSSVVRQPARVEPDPHWPRRRRFYGPHPKRECWLMAVVSYEERPARLVAAAVLRSPQLGRLEAPW